MESKSAGSRVREHAMSRQNASAAVMEMSEALAKKEIAFPSWLMRYPRAGRFTKGNCRRRSQRHDRQFITGSKESPGEPMLKTSSKSRHGIGAFQKEKYRGSKRMGITIPPRDGQSLLPTKAP
jgi:hypothetical protein